MAPCFLIGNSHFLIMLNFFGINMYLLNIMWHDMHAQQWPQGHPCHRPTLTLTPSVVKHTLMSRLLNCKKMGISALIKYGTCFVQVRISCDHHNFSLPDINSSLKWRMDPVHVLGRVFLFLSPLPMFHHGPPRTNELTLACLVASY